jgi:hypothetical protein
MHLPAWRFGKPYESLERDTLVHFLTGEPVAEVSQVGGAIVGRDLQKAAQARKALLAIDPEEIVERIQTAGNLYANGTVTVGDTKQSRSVSGGITAGFATFLGLLVATLIWLAFYTKLI